MRHWTANEQTYVELNIDRLRIETIARRLGRSRWAVIDYCNRNHIRATKTSMLTTAEVAAKLGVSVQRVSYLARTKRLRARRVPGGRWWLFYPGQFSEG